MSTTLRVSDATGQRAAALASSAGLTVDVLVAPALSDGLDRR